MNKIMLIGNLGRDPEMSYTTSGTAITRFTMAVNRVTRQGGERKEETEWFNIVAWNQLAETCNTYLKKGQKVFVEGRVQQRRFTDRNGQERTAFDVVINDMEMLTPKNQQPSAGDNYLGGESDDSLGDLDDHPF
ncbi:MAG TPA: single-stranded DNA-binding protein [Dictyobacter sp.]|jgi:single-strand DNA-binding protein|nr:single-stranded DNA-binding protein [Dictyobacter sp.]